MRQYFMLTFGLSSGSKTNLFNSTALLSPTQSNSFPRHVEHTSRWRSRRGAGCAQHHDCVLPTVEGARKEYVRSRYQVPRNARSLSANQAATTNAGEDSSAASE